MKRIHLVLVTLLAAVLLAASALPQAFGEARGFSRGATEVSLQIEGPFAIYVNGELVYSQGAGPTPTVTLTPPATPTTGPTATAQPTAEPSHDTGVWHPPAEGHHHGADPMSAHPDIVAFLQDNPEFLSIGHPWLSSPIENVFADHGKHAGFKNLIESNISCTDPRGGMIDPCITDYYYQVHSTGTAAESRVRIHSHKGVFRVCNFERTQCGIVATGGHADFSQLHSQYKTTVCPVPGFVDTLPEPYHGDQPPYTAISGSRPGSFIFWNNQINPVVFQYYDPLPNRILQAAWSERAWSVPASGEGPECLDPAFDVMTGANATQFQVFTFNLKIRHMPRPFSGFTDVYGAIAPHCTESGAQCVPLYISAGVPFGEPRLNRVVDHGDPTDAPIQDFDNGHEFVMPMHP